jgi:chloramphenicol O-acetyltransferase
MSREARVNALLKTFTPPRNKTEKLAFRYLFSTLSALEEIAVLAAERGAGVEGQLEDEYVHRDTFKQLAVACGGFEDPCDKTQQLIDFLQSLQGEKSIAALNVVSEAWLGCVFTSLSKLAPALFDSIGEDESRHNHYALSYKIPDSEELEPIIRRLERMMVEIAKSPNFILPIIYLVGLSEVGHMGIDMIKNHTIACRHLDIEPNTKEFESFCRTSIHGGRNTPELVPMNDWQFNKQSLWKRPAPMTVQNEIKINTSNEIKVQAKVIEAIGRITRAYPEFRNVTRDNKLYRTRQANVGVRVMWSDDILSTIIVNSKNNYKELLKNIISRTKRIRSKPYDIIGEVDHIKDLLPPSQVPFVISYIGHHNLRWGHGVFSEFEGSSTSVFIGAPDKNNLYPITVLMDHRVFDGKDIALFTDKLKHYLEIVN